MTNDPSPVQRLNNYELAMHVMLDRIIDNEVMDFGGLTLPMSVIMRLQDALETGALTGTLETE